MKRVNEATTIFMPYASAECRNAMNDIGKEGARN
jgi:hypothetical protein